MKYITENWEKYFESMNDGLGTTYERFVLHRYFSRIKQEYSIKSVLESPSFGMTGVSGINSMWWAAQGVRVNIVDHESGRLDLIRGVWADLLFCDMSQFTLVSSDRLPFPDGSFELGWNFAAIGLSENPAGCIDELSRVASKVLFICIPNATNIFNWFRVRDRAVKKHGRDGSSGEIIKRLLVHGWRLVDDGYFDAPPWPDIAMAKENMLRKIGLGKLATRMEAKEGGNICILDYFNGKNPNMEKEILRLGVFENAPRFFKKLWAHHRFLLFVRKNI
jgi:hypothetical protein